MTRSVAGVNAWMRDPVNYNRHQGGGWHNRCEQFTNNGGDFDESFDTAYLAAKASGPLNRSTVRIPDGAIGFWRGVWIDGEECGHTAIMYRGRWMMASDAVTEMVGNGTGTITPAEYAIRRPAAIWLGWTFRHGTQTLKGAGTAALDVETITEAAPEEDDMSNTTVIIANANVPGQFSVVTPKNGWSDLEYGAAGAAQLRGYEKIATVENAGKKPDAATLSGEEYIATRANYLGDEKVRLAPTSLELDAFHIALESK